MENIQIIRTDSGNPDFVKLVAFLDAELTIADGDDHEFYSGYNKIDQIRHVVLVKNGDQALGCGSIKEFEPGIMEIKRMYVLPDFRGRGLASMILANLESWARELSVHTCILETGKRQPEAIQLYKKNNYQQRPNYGQYEGIENSLCFEKRLDEDLQIS